jgi:hypothetical protein
MELGVMVEETAHEFAERLFNSRLGSLSPFETFEIMVADRDAAVRAAAMEEAARIADERFTDRSWNGNFRYAAKAIAEAIRRQPVVPAQTEPAPPAPFRFPRE